MSVTSGFFNSLNHDRRYNAQQFSALFDGIINDGVFANIGAAFAIKADTGVTVTIDKGKAWFNSAWVYNDAILPLTFDASEVVLDRIDAIVIEVDHSEAVRLGDIKIVKGTPSSSPQRPAMADTTNKHQYPLAYIYRKAGSTVITQADITNMVGTSSCPYITGILQVQNIDNIVAQWEAQWNQWYAEQVSEAGSATSELTAEMKSDFDIWFADVRAILDNDVALALANKVAELQGKFDDLAREGAVYDTLEDSDLDVILSSDGTPIEGKTVFGNSSGSGRNGPIDADSLQGHTADDFRPSDWIPTAQEVGARPSDWMPTASEVGAIPQGCAYYAADSGKSADDLEDPFALIYCTDAVNKSLINALGLSAGYAYVLTLYYSELSWGKIQIAFSYEGVAHMAYRTFRGSWSDWTVGFGSTDGILPVSQGGTGASTLAAYLMSMFPNAGTSKYIPMFGSNWEDRKFATPTELKTAMGINSYFNAYGAGSTDELTALKNNWPVIAVGAFILFTILNNGYRTFLGVKVDNNNGAVIEVSYGSNSIYKYRVNGGTWYEAAIS